MSTIVKVVRHNYVSYNRRSCRCEHCKADNIRYRRELRARPGRSLFEHGLSGYTNRGCRCAKCRKAMADYWADWNANRKAAKA